MLHPSPFDDFSHEEKELCRRYDVFMRFHSKDEHEELLKTVVSEHRILKRIRELKVFSYDGNASLILFPTFTVFIYK